MKCVEGSSSQVVQFTLSGCTTPDQIPRDFPEEFDVLIDDLNLKGCSPGELQMRMQELDNVTRLLRGLGYECKEHYDAATKRTYFNFSKWRKS